MNKKCGQKHISCHESALNIEENIISCSHLGVRSKCFEQFTIIRICKFIDQRFKFKDKFDGKIMKYDVFGFQSRFNLCIRIRYQKRFIRRSIVTVE